MKNDNRTINNIVYAIKLIWKCAPGYLVWEIIYGVLMGVWGSAAIVFVQVFYKSLFDDSDFSKIILIVAIMLGLTIVFNLWLQWYRNICKPVKQQLLNYKINQILFAKNAELDVDCYNKTEFYNDFVWAIGECDAQMVGVVDSISTTLQHIIAFIISSEVMASVSPVLAIIAVVTSIAHIILQKSWIKSDLKRKIALNPHNRKNSYYEHLFDTPEYAKDMRISRVSEIIFEKYEENQKSIKKTHVDYNTQLLKYIIPFNLLSGVMQPVVYGVLFYQIIVCKSLEFASLAVAFNAFWSLRFRIQGIIDLFMKYHQHGLYIGQVRKYMEYEPTVHSGNILAPAFESMELKNVSFGYTSDTIVLHHINMKIHHGEKIAFVGYNGAGKSSLVNLLLHLYDPVQGEVLYNGHALSEYDADSLHLRIGVVLQDFRIFALSLAENVICDIYDTVDEEKVLSALENACFDSKLKALPNGIMSELTKEFYQDGVNLSGGELQKIAISRIFAAPFDVIIMDEPSAALDPRAEYELNMHLKEYAKDKTVIVISHRLSTTCLMDRIYMFEKGKIVEEGSHSELMESNGKYARLFNMQADKYR